MAAGYTAAVVGLALVTTLFYVQISYAQRNFSTALSDKNVAGFYAAVRAFAWLIVVAAPLFSFSSWVEERLVLAWRAHLTRHLARAYFSDRSFYHIQMHSDAGSGGLEGPAGEAAGGSVGPIDNPDQRICDDVASFVRASVSLGLSVCRKIFNCVAFASVLWGVSGHLVVLLFVYAGVGTVLTVYVFGRPLTDLYFRTLAREADLRFSLVRVRENAEAIAFYRGEPSERGRVLARLASVLLVSNQRIRWGAAYDLWTSVFSYATILVPTLVTAPRYFAGEIEFGVISQASFAFGRIEAALSVIVMNLVSLSGLAAGTERLDALTKAMRGHSGGGGGGSRGAGTTLEEQATKLLLSPHSSSSSCTDGGGPGAGIVRRFEAGGQGVKVQRLSLRTPGGEQLLCRDVSLTLLPGQSLLVVGPSGCGKSSLMRAVAGLWAGGSGDVVLPAPESSCFFLPQRAFMPLGSLRTQLTFPLGVPADAQELAAQEHGAAAAWPWASRASGTPSSSAAGGGGRLRRGAGAAAAARSKRNGGGSSDDDDEEAPLGSPGGRLAAAAAAAGPTEMAPLLGRNASSGGKGGHPSSSSGGGGGGGANSTGEAGGAAAGGAGALAGSGLAPAAVSDGELVSRLEEVCLPDLAKRFGGLDVELDWSAVLSVGEQQRVALLRLLLARPAVAFLDEATSALDGPTEGQLYALVRQRVGCYVSVGHRMMLLQHHTHVLEAKGGGEWELCTSAEYQKRLAQRTGLHI